MLNLQKRIKGIDENKEYLGTRISIRDKLLSQGGFISCDNQTFIFTLEVKELEHRLRDVRTCKLSFPSTSALHEMELTVTPATGLYANGVFKFSIHVPPEYNNVVR